MTRTDKKVLFTALAFVAMTMRSGETKSTEAAEQIRQLADLIEIYCAENVIDASAAVSDESSALVIDDVIEKHLRELREAETTILPADKQTLVKMLDRLEHRKARRQQRDFYAFTSVEKLADQALSLLDEELVGDGRMSLI